MTPDKEKTTDIIQMKKDIHPKLKGSPLEKVIDEFIDLMPELNSKIHHINQGGCGIFALLLWKKLIALGYTDIEAVPILFTSPFEAPYDLASVSKNFQDVVNGTADFEVPWEHIPLVLLDKRNSVAIIVDSASIAVTESLNVEGHFLDPFHEIGNPISMDTLEKLIDLTDWNEAFDRKQVPLLSEILATLA